MLKDVQKLPNENIIVVKYKAPFQPIEDIGEAQRQIAEILDAEGQTMYRIDDLSQADMVWNQFVEGIAEATKDVAGSMTDARINGVLVGDYEMVELASKSMTQDQYGATSAPVFNSLDDALAHARQNNV